MCLSSPKAPPPLPEPVKPQEAKAPDVSAIYRSKKAKTGDGGPVAGGTFLTGPSGIDNNMLSVGKTILGS